ncbi:choice-of-anchor D domain-containing protein [Nocardioides humilatus]|uniref:Choice-of-anchor D domain-containing protein n=1 Tax=Nocardioides humilatus TaxID=2607660 RepID=A0A5B1LQ19_9ACTN|nr:choice-of-anchor D domain-containing protein [Nocardioides humilatus]
MVPTGGAGSPSTESARIVLTFQVPPEAAVSPTSWAFPGTEVGGQSSGKIFTFTNTGPVPVAVSSVQLGGESPSQFVLSANTCPANLPANNACSVTVAFSPTSPGSKNATLTFNSNAYGGPHVVGLSGMSVATALLSIRGPGKTYAEGHGNRQTLTISKSTSAKATFYFKVTNNVGIDRDYRIVADGFGAAADVSVTPEKKKTPLPLDAFGRWITPTVPGGGSITLAFRVDPTDLGQVTARHILRLLTPSGAEHDNAAFETNVQAPSKGTDGYGLYVKSAGKYAGGDLNGQTVTQEPAATGDTLKYTVRVRNDSAAAQSVLVKVQAASNLCWSISVKYKKADLTSAFLTGGYTTPSIKKGGSLSLAVAVTRLSDGCGAATWEFSTWDGPTKVHYSSILANALAGTE